VLSPAPALLPVHHRHQLGLDAVQVGLAALELGFEGLGLLPDAPVATGERGPFLGLRTARHEQIPDRVLLRLLAIGDGLPERLALADDGADQCRVAR